MPPRPAAVLPGLERRRLGVQGEELMLRSTLQGAGACSTSSGHPLTATVGGMSHNGCTARTSLLAQYVSGASYHTGLESMFATILPPLECSKTLFRLEVDITPLFRLLLG